MLHLGIDWFSIARALAKWPFRGRFNGISTVEQQLARTVFPNLRRRRWLHKFSEFWIAARLARKVPKHVIWFAYLQCAYYGLSYTGYPKIRAKFAPIGAELDCFTAAQIVSCLKYPIPSDQSEHWRRIHNRRTKYVIGRLKLLREGRLGRRLSGVLLQWNAGRATTDCAC